MSVQEIEAATNEFFDAFSRNDMGAVASMLSDNLEVFDHVPYRFDSKKEFPTSWSTPWSELSRAASARANCRAGCLTTMLLSRMPTMCFQAWVKTASLLT